jgi:hypothetical protein
MGNMGLKLLLEAQSVQPKVDATCNTGVEFTEPPVSGRFASVASMGPASESSLSTTVD